MRRTILILFSLLPLLVIAEDVKKMRVISNDGNESSYALSSITKQTFDVNSGQMTVSFNDGSSAVDFALNSISKVNFFTDMPTRQNTLVLNSNIKFYPMPVKSELTIRYTATSQHKITVQIINLNGKIITSNIYSTSRGINEKTIGLSGLSTGIYLCRIMNDKEIISQQIIKE